MARQRRTPRQVNAVDAERVQIQPASPNATAIPEDNVPDSPREYIDPTPLDLDEYPQGEVPGAFEPTHSDGHTENTETAEEQKHEETPAQKLASESDPNPVPDSFESTSDSDCEVKPTSSGSDTPSVRDLIRGRQSAQSSEKPDNAPATGSVLKGIIDSRKPLANKIGVAEEIRNRKAGRKSGSSVSQVIFDRRYRRN